MLFAKTKGLILLQVAFSLPLFKKVRFIPPANRLIPGG